MTNKIMEFFKNKNLESRIKEFETSSATVKLAAEAIGCTEADIAKSITFKVNEKGIMIVASGDAKIDNSKFKEKFLTKATMLTKEEVELLIGQKVGGVCPFCLDENVEVYLDLSLKRFNEVYPACGSENSVIKLKIDELEKYSNYREWIDVCKGWMNNITK